MNFLNDFTASQLWVIFLASHLILMLIGFVAGLNWGPKREVKQRKIVGYIITLLWAFMHIIAAATSTDMGIMVDVIMAIFATSIYGDDFVAIIGDKLSLK